LEATYGRPRHGNPTGPLADLVYVTLSNATQPGNAHQVYRALRERYPTWRALLGAPRDEVAAVLRPAGFAHRRAEWYQEALACILRDVGSLEEDEVEDAWASLSDAKLLDHLTGLPGVGPKVARCVMLYALDRDVLPVDRHVYRLAVRLGWTDAAAPETSHGELEALVPPHRRYVFHVCGVAHGRARCFETDPACEECPVQRHCRYYAEVVSA
jgi:endonuclease-3